MESGQFGVTHTNALVWATAACVSLAVAVGIMLIGKGVVMGVVGGLAAFAGLAALVSAEGALCALIVVASVDGFLKSALSTALVVVLKDIVLALALAHWLWDAVNGQPRRSLSLRVALPAFIFILYCAAQMFNSETMSWMLAIAGLRSWIIWIPVFFIAYDTLRTRRQLNHLMWVMALVAGGTAVYAVVQTQIGFAHLLSLSPRFDYYVMFRQGDTVRAPSTYVNPGACGEAMAFTAMACAGAALGAPLASASQLVFAAGSVLSVIGLMAAGSRAPLISAVTSVLVAASFARQGRLLIGVAVMAALGISQTSKYVGPEAFQRYGSRYINPRGIWERVTTPLAKGVEMVARHPLGTGVASGVGTARALDYFRGPLVTKRETASFVESEFGRALKELGLPGLALFVWLLGCAMWAGVSGCLRTAGRDRLVAAALIGAAAGVAMHLAVGSALYLAPGGIYFWMACALAARMPSYAAQTPAAIPERTPEEQEAWEELLQRAGQTRGTAA